MPQTSAYQLPSPRQTGFTVLEVMIVLLMSSMLMLAASSVFLTMLTSRARSATDQILKSEGNYALQRMEFLIRNGISLQPNSQSIICDDDPTMTNLVVKSVDGGVTTFSLLPDLNDGSHPKIASNSGTYLTSSAVEVSQGPTFTCNEDVTTGSRFVTIDFTLSKNNRSQRFSTSVNMRNN